MSAGTDTIVLIHGLWMTRWPHCGLAGRADLTWRAIYMTRSMSVTDWCWAFLTAGRGGLWPARPGHRCPRLSGASEPGPVRGVNGRAGWPEA